MTELIRLIESVQAKLEGWRRHALKETQTRVTVIDPILQALGWDVRDVDEVELEHPTVDNKSVDYALKINRKPVLLVEAKALDDPLNDVKAVTQIVGYAANDGIDWCVLTNGIVWRVYKSSEKCAAPDKLMFQVSLDPRQDEGLPVAQRAEQLWRLSREEMAKGTLDVIGEQTFTDGKVRKALDTVMRAPPRAILNAVREAVNDETLTPQKIKESVVRIWRQRSPSDVPLPLLSTVVAETSRKRAGRKAAETRRKGIAYGEAHRIAGKPREVVELYTDVDKFCMSLDPSIVHREHRQLYAGYKKRQRLFCVVVVQHSGLRIFVKLKHSRLKNAPEFSRDVTTIGHWGSSALTTELSVNTLSQLPIVKQFIRQAFDSLP